MQCPTALEEFLALALGGWAWDPARSRRRLASRASNSMRSPLRSALILNGRGRVAKQKNPNSVSSAHPPPPPPAAAVPIYQAHISRLHNTSSSHSIKANYNDKYTVLKSVLNSKEYQSPHHNYKGAVICEILPVSWHFILLVRFSYQCLLLQHQYCINFLMLNKNDCMCITVRGRLRVGVGVVVNKTQFTR